jgi:hypothetical protein
MTYRVYHISTAEGRLHRKVGCPDGEIEQQLAPGETYEEVDPLVGGFGVADMDGLNASEPNWRDAS